MDYYSFSWFIPIMDLIAREINTIKITTPRIVMLLPQISAPVVTPSNSPVALMGIAVLIDSPRPGPTYKMTMITIREIAYVTTVSIVLILNHPASA